MSNLPAALDLAQHGWHIFPCVPTGPKAKAPLTTNGFHDATDDQDQVRAWWTKHPAAMIGAPVAAHLIVLDIDPRNGGSLEALEQVTGPLPATLTVHSGRGDGGRHLYYQRPQGDLTSTKLPKGIDLKVGGRGYCILPPSQHPATGKPYAWEGGTAARLPYQAMEAMRRTVIEAANHRIHANRDALVSFVQASIEGERNSRLFWAACRAHEQGDDHTLSLIFDAALAAGLSDREAASTIASAKNTTGGVRA